MNDYNNLFNTVKLYVTYNDDTKGTATAFFFKYNNLYEEKILLITNNHVVENVNEIIFLLHASFEAPGNIRKLSLGGNDMGKIIKKHHSCDLCAIDITNYLQDDKYFALEFSNIINDTDLTYENIMQDVFIVGYPIGIEDELNKLPIFSTGVTATSILIDYNGRSEILLNAFALPGSSGSPVFTKINGEPKLIGIISLGKVYSDGKPISNLCIAIKAQEIEELIK